MSLIVGFTCANLLVSFLVYETNTDVHSNQNGQTYQLFSNDPFSDDGSISYITDATSEYLKSNFPEVKSTCQVRGYINGLVEVGDSKLTDEKILIVDTSFFSVFDFPLIAGSDKKLNPKTVVLTKQKAINYFGTTDVIGKELAIKGKDSTLLYSVVGVFNDLEANSHLQFDGIIAHKLSDQQQSYGGGATYALLNTSADAQALQSKLNEDPLRPGLIGPGKSKYAFESLNKSYFNPANRMPYMKSRSELFIKLGYLVCGLILSIACFNFINLFLLSWRDRKKEVGIKKVLGISHVNLFSFTVVEVGAYLLAAFAVSLACTFFLIPVFNEVLGTNLAFPLLFNFKVSLSILLIILLVGILVSCIAVWNQWRMKPISLMGQQSSKVVFSKVLFTIQFIVAIVLLICAVTITEQMNYVKNAPLGFNKHIIQFRAPLGTDAKTLGLLKNEFTQISGVKHASLFNGNPISGNLVMRVDLEDGKFYSPYLFAGDEDLINTLDLKLIQGRLPQKDSEEKLVNETLIKQFGITNPLDSKVPGNNDIIVGVVKDFTCGSFKQEIPPVIISFSEKTYGLLVDYSGANLSEVLPQLGKSWSKIYGDRLMTPTIIHDELMKKYKDETAFYKIVVAFAAVIIGLSAFGLFALSWSVVQSRSKEIGIRKVLGATVSNIFNLLTVTFTKRILVAIVIATPVGYYVMQIWLQRFVNRIDLHIGIFGIAVGLIFLVAFATLSVQTIKAAFTNPIHEIKHE